MKKGKVVSKIFGIAIVLAMVWTMFGGVIVTVNAASVPFFSQRDSRWKDDLIIDENGVTCGTIGSETLDVNGDGKPDPIGCAMTSAAMILKYYGVDTDPKQLNSWLNANKGYAAGGNLYWQKPADYSSGKVQYRDDLSKSKPTDWPTNNDWWADLKQNLDQGCLVVVLVDAYPSTPSLDSHFVLVTGFKGGAVDYPGNYYMNDPWDLSFNADKTLLTYYDSTYNNTFFAMRVYEGADSPPSCSIQLLDRTTGSQITEVAVNNAFHIYVIASDDLGITQVRFSSDDAQDGNPTGSWTEWLSWGTSQSHWTGYWDAASKKKEWTFTTTGSKEVWAEVKDTTGQIKAGKADIYCSSNNPPQLSSGYVDPSNATPSTNFYYYVTYFDPDGDSPSVKQVYIDGVAYTMTWYSGLNSHITYRYGPKNLSAGGTHYYFFYFEDGKGGTVRLPSGIDMYLGPTVTGQNNPPNTPSNPSPANHVTGVSISADLSWSGGDPNAGDTVTYDVYFGTSSSPAQVSSNQSGTTYDLGTLAYNTKYYWKVVATDDYGASTTGPLWDFTTTPVNQVVTFPDPNLESAVRQAISKPEGPIYASELERLTNLSTGPRSISNLTGLEHCTSLIYLYLIDNQINDISPLSPLTGLTHLDLSCNQINDISPLSTLTGLTYLDLTGNPIGDISPLSTLTGLKELWLVDNQINDISALSTLTGLTRLSLAANQIDDISPLSTLTGLTELYIGANQINDISPLSTLTSLRVLYIYMNQIDDISPLSTLTGLTGLDLTDNRISNIAPLSTLINLTYLSLSDNQISDISPLSTLTSLTDLCLSDNQVDDISAVSTLTSLNSLILSGNQINDVSTLVQNTGLGEGDMIDLRGNPLGADSLNTYIPQLEARGVNVLYDVPRTWYVDDDLVDYPGADFTRIQEAVNAASSGDTIIVYPGTYIENINVNKDPLTIQSESGAEVTTVQAANPDDHVFEITANYVNVRGFIVSGATEGAGINLDHADYCNISDNSVLNNFWGIQLHYSNNNNLTNNSVNSNSCFGIDLISSSSNSLTSNSANSNSLYGIYLYWSSNNALTNNVANSNGESGIYLYYSGHNNLANNTMSGNKYNFTIYAHYLTDFINNVDTSNKVDGKPVYYWIDESERQIPTDAGFVAIVNCRDITVRDLTLANNYYGVLVAYSEDSKLENVNTSNNNDGIYLCFSSNNSLTNNTARDNYNGIYLFYSDTNTLTTNIASSNTGEYGIALICSSGNNLTNNIASWNQGYGIYLQSSSNNNSLTNNHAHSNTGSSIMLFDNSINNCIYLNNFTNVYSSSDSTNIWNSPEEVTYTYNGNTYTSYLGNYWSDYTGSDADGDGIGETPYPIDSDADNYPLREPFENYAIVSPGDTTPPITPLVTVDGGPFAGTTQLHASWDSSDPESGIVEYQYAMGTSAGGTDVVSWTSAGTASEVTEPVTGLSVGTTYYFAVKAKNGQGLWSEVGASNGITVAAVVLDLPSDWMDKQLFYPIYSRVANSPGSVVIGVGNKRDMWYLVEVYTRTQEQPVWTPLLPQQWNVGEYYLPILQPYGTRTFTYTPKLGEEIKIVVSNNLNDEVLRSLYYLDFATRALLGISISPALTDNPEFIAKLFNLIPTLSTSVGYLFQGEFREAIKSLALELGTETVQVSFSELLSMIGISATKEALAGAALSVAAKLLINAPIYGPLFDNTNKAPFIEEVIYTSKAKIKFAPSDIRVIDSLRLVESAPYNSGETITAEFTIVNRDVAPIKLTLLTAGGRGPRGDTDIHDFTFDTDVILNPGECHSYEGELFLSDTGQYHFFVAYQTADGVWCTSVPTEGSATNTLDIEVGPLPDRLAANLCSPGELRVYDSQNRVTGLVNGQVKQEIPDSIYFEQDRIVVIYSPSDTYRYEVAGTDEGTYGLDITLIEDGGAMIFAATDIPTTSGVVHDYTIDWEALLEGEGGVTVQIDADGDGLFEDTFTSDEELTQDEFMLQTATVIDFDPDTLNLKDKDKYVTAYIELPLGYNVSQINISSIRLNGTVPALTKPTQVGDHDKDRVPDLMVKFDASAVKSLLIPGSQVEITITGEVTGMGFQGSDTIRVIGGDNMAKFPGWLRWFLLWLFGWR